MLVLGTAALGFPYGVVNKMGKLDQKAVTKIVEAAWDNGIEEFDTAQMYGDSEAFLGVAFKELGIRDQVSVITKLNPSIEPTDNEGLTDSIIESFERLGIDRLHGLLLHREYWLNYWNEGLWETLQPFVDTGQISKLGVSVYQYEYALKALETDGIEILQHPSSILDRRFEHSGVFDLYLDKEIYIRNIFLQGLLLMKPEECPIDVVRPELEKVSRIVERYGLTRQELTINYLKLFVPRAKLIAGVETPEQVKMAVDAYNKEIVFKTSLISDVISSFPDTKDEVLIPIMWKKK